MAKLYDDVEETELYGERPSITYDELQQIKIGAEYDIKLGKALDRLKDTEDFKTVFMTDYADEYPKRLANLIASGRVNKAQTDAMYEEMLSVSLFKRHLQSVMTNYKHAQDTVNEAETEYNRSLESDGSV